MGNSDFAEAFVRVQWVRRFRCSASLKKWYLPERTDAHSTTSMKHICMHHNLLILRWQNSILCSFRHSFRGDALKMLFHFSRFVYIYFSRMELTIHAVLAASFANFYTIGKSQDPLEKIMYNYMADNGNWTAMKIMNTTRSNHSHTHTCAERTGTRIHCDVISTLPTVLKLVFVDIIRHGAVTSDCRRFDLGNKELFRNIDTVASSLVFAFQNVQLCLNENSIPQFLPTRDERVIIEFAVRKWRQ